MMALLLTGTIGSQFDSLFFGLDYPVFQFMGSIQDHFLTILAKGFTALGSTIFVALFALMGLVMIFFRRTRKVGIAIVVAVIIGTLITNIIVKPAVLRLRPYNTLQYDVQYWSWYVGAGMLSESDYCFPSGHTTGATEIAVALLLCHATSKRKNAKVFCWLFPVAALFVGASRIYLMVHYTTDVLAGFIVGTVAGILGFVAATLICRSHKNPEDTETQKLLRRNITPVGIVAIILGFCVIYTLSVFNIRSNGGTDAIRCAYDEEYNCQNEAATGSKYPAINGEYYCKIHWNELNEGN